MGAREDQENRKNKIFKVASATAIMDVCEEFDIGKLSFFLVEQAQPKNKVLTHYLDVDRFLVVATDIVQCAFTGCWPKGYKEFKGSPRDGGHQARVLDISYVQGNNYPYAIKLSQGVGQVVGHGAVKMVKEDISGRITVSEIDMRALALRVIHEAQAYRTACQMAKMSGLNERMAG